jgi:hypothetical protein
METYDSDVIFIHGEPREIRYGQLEHLTQATISKEFKKLPKHSTLVCEHHLKPEDYIMPIVILPGKHFSDIKYQGLVRGWLTDERYLILTVLLSKRDYNSEWIKAGIMDTRRRIWFVDPT